MMLAQSGLNFPNPKLTVSERVGEGSRSSAPAALVDDHAVQEILSDDGSTADEFEDASDVVMEDMFVHDLVPSRPQPLSEYLIYIIFN